MSLLSVTDLQVHLPTKRGTVHAVNGVSLDVGYGETVGLIGESGCGKSTLGKALTRLVPSTAGTIALEGQDLTRLNERALRALRPKVQMIFQDNYSALNPRHSVGHSIAQPLRLAGWSRSAARARVEDLLGKVGLSPDAAQRLPDAFSGGQRQRIGIARAIAVNPKLVICDEPVSALDVSVRAQVLNLLGDLQTELAISYLFISHDLAVVEHIADRILVMYLGFVVEEGRRETFWRSPLHPYTQALLAAVPAARPDAAKARDKTLLAGELPSNLHLPEGCPFQARCPLVEARCRVERPRLRDGAGGNRVACHLAPAADAARPAPTPQPPALRIVGTRP
ncbi:ATP-binding cassette domain-containing protein [Sphingomonas sp. AP4-R1]|uniref:ABC transporter ATP-binding protein n=1 Tax=Sphingomonas sp. AP4-R1 TaxID=2735134 RepID=UPI0014932F45|nr:oligopeptide/dipeptide ABC transporter ATP-binding protein [Sphingomonas sp. AP4-R1]QJU57362.1 ATP-binding cassette domain-containing protein [Sphingomonas sp. AP4-R1]